MRFAYKPDKTMTRYQWFNVVEPTVFCCDAMREAWREKAVGFGDYEDGKAAGETDIAINIYQCSPWPEGAAWTSFTINFCPFCGEAITMEAQ